MPAPNSAPVTYRFGPFELASDPPRLLRGGVPVPLAPQPLRLLEMLIAAAPAVVTREQLRAALWPDGTVVAFEVGLNSAVRRLRAALEDKAVTQPFIGTVAGQGYRFIAPPERPPVAAAEASRAHRWPWVAAAVLAALGLLGWFTPRVPAPPRVLNVRALTTDGGMDLWARPASDSTFIYYLDRAGGHWNLMSNSGDPDSARVVDVPFPNTRLFAVSRDGTQWLLGSFSERGVEADLWREARPGGAPVRLGNLRAYDAVWDPDGAHIEYSSGNALWKAGADGSAPQKLATLPADPDWMSWSPDGQRLRFFANSELWEWRPDHPAQALPFPRLRCCGAWSRDGRYFFFSAQENGIWTLWAQRITAPWPWRVIPGLRPEPRQLLSLPRNSFGAYADFGRNQVVFYETDPRPDPERCEPGLVRCLPLLPGRSALEIRFSPDGRQVAYLDTRDSSIWTADVGPDLAAHDFRRLSPSGATADQPHWSPDGRWIAYASQRAGQMQNAYRVAAGGGPEIPLVGGAAARSGFGNPFWSPDGKRLVADEGVGSQHHIVILSSGQPHVVPGSGSYTAPHWSPDGAWLSGVSIDQHQVAVYNFARRVWQVVARGHTFSNPLWSADGRYLYFQDLLAAGEPLYRMRTGVWKPEVVATFSALLRDGVHRCAFIGFAPDGDFMIALNGSGADLYAATLKLP